MKTEIIFKMIDGGKEEVVISDRNGLIASTLHIGHGVKIPIYDEAGKLKDLTGVVKTVGHTLEVKESRPDVPVKHIIKVRMTVYKNSEK